MQSLFELSKYFKKYRNTLLLGVLFIILSNIALVYVPLILKDGINALQNNVSYSDLYKYAALIIASSFISGVFRFFIRETIIASSRKIEYDMRQDFWQHIIKLPMKYFNSSSTGNIMAHATNDINAVRMFVGPAVMYSIDTSIRLLIVIVIMLNLSISLTLYALIPLPILSYLVYKVGKKIHDKFTKIQEKFSDLTTKAQENFSGIRVVKSYVREESEIKDFQTLSDQYLNRNMEMIKIQSFFYPVLYMITGLSIIIVIWVGGTKIIQGSMNLGEISAFIIYLGMLIWPMIAFGWIVNIIQQASASWKRLKNIFNEKYEIQDNEFTDNSLKIVKGNIEFKNVSFKYSESLDEVLKDLTFEIPVGSTAAIIGNTGSGKSTLVNLIPRLYDISSGEILIDGIDIKKYPLEILRKNIGFVPQETFLFSDTLANNILYGVKAKNMNLVESVAEISQLKNDVDQFPNKYETILGERGITLSGGQKQRTCLARALAVDPRILILDDSFSAVDTSTEEKILHNLKDFMEDRTSIIISHRISTVKNADIIFVLKDGKIAEQGNHESLVELNGIYAELHFKQLLEKELEELN